MTAHDALDPWWTRGNCRDLPKSEVDRVFFPGGAPGSHSKRIDDEAKRVCHGCPVKLACLRYAVELEIGVGTYGGMTDLERRKRFHGGGRRRPGPKPGGRIA